MAQRLAAEGEAHASCHWAELANQQIPLSRSADGLQQAQAAHAPRATQFRAAIELQFHSAAICLPWMHEPVVENAFKDYLQHHQAYAGHPNKAQTACCRLKTVTTRVMRSTPLMWITKSAISISRLTLAVRQPCYAASAWCSTCQPFDGLSSPRYHHQ
eukprot:2839543-Pleurochrysis_carterae.AAC.4